ncbi:MAG: 4Fe-4S dicluster domain-containing protein [Candidatus Schekmanbacteria bacterium]|nr:4Fe-4S dicluster domain-containing protein [Candidatus Schekmanbacteria bacterium]
MERREFVKAGLLCLPFIGLSGWLVNDRLEKLSDITDSRGRVYLRPPGALPEKEFISTCIKCGRCGEVCPNDTLNFFDEISSPALVGTPYFIPREKACMLCMKCTQICPSGALVKVESDDGDVISKVVKIGTAEVDKNICNSYNGIACGVCVRACPYSGIALSAETWERPVVNVAACVGCGLCEQICIHAPQAIRVKPAGIQRV